MIKQTWLNLAAIAASLMSVNASESAGQASDAGSAERTVQVVVGPFVAVGGGMGQASASARIPEAVFMYRLMVELVDSAGHPVLSGPSWQLQLKAGNTALRPLALMTSELTELRLPRPFGYRLERSDSFVVNALTEDLSAGPYYLRLTIQYESANGAVSRLSVLPSALRISAETNAVRQVGEWTADVDGRLLAVTGEQLDHARELQLLDVESGEVLWRRTNTQGPRFDQAGNFVRLAVAIRAGRTYRLIALHDGSKNRPSLGLAMLLPN